MQRAVMLALAQYEGVLPELMVCITMPVLRQSISCKILLFAG